MKKNVAKVVGATSSEAFLVLQLLTKVLLNRYLAIFIARRHNRLLFALHNLRCGAIILTRRLEWLKSTKGSYSSCSFSFCIVEEYALATAEELH